MDENKNKDLDTGDGFFDDIPTNAEGAGDMGDGFFDDIPNGQAQNSYNQERKECSQYVPTQTRSRKSKGKLIGKIIGTVALAAFVFFSGMLTTWLCLDDGIRTLIKIKRTIDKEYYQDVSDDEFYRVLFSAINDDLLDPYSEYMTGEEYRALEQSLAGRHSGIGVVFSVAGEDAETQIKVHRVVENSPAEQAGLQIGDRIIGFGKSKTELTYSVDFDRGFKPFLETLAESEPFYLAVQRGDSQKLVEISKEFYVESYVSYRTNKTSYHFTGANALTYTEKGQALTCLSDDTAYIKLSQFTGNAVAGFDRVMAQFKEDGMKNLVLDLRENGGGYLDYVQYISKYFCKNATAKAPLMTVADYGEKKEYYSAAGNVYNEYFAEDSRIVVLADSGTASASECLIGCMIDYGTIGYTDICLSTRNGEAKTYGKGIMQTTFYLDASKKDFLKLTTAELKWPVSGKSIHGRGVLPEDGALTVAENHEKDVELNNALALLFS